MHITAFQTAVESSRSIAELITTVKQAQPLIRFLNKWQLFIYFIAMTITLCIVTTAIYCHSLFNLLTAAIFTLVMLVIVISLVILLPDRLRKNSITYLSDLIHKKNILLNNQLSAIAFDKKQQIEILSNVFHEFKRGDHLKEIAQLYRGYYQGETYCFNYYFYSLHYTTRAKHARSNRKKAQRKSIIQPYYRHGIYLPFHFANNILILSEPPDRHNTKPVITLSPFNIELSQLPPTKEIFFFAQDESSLSHFLNPEVTKELGVIIQQFNQINIEFSAQSELCMSFSNDPLISFKRRYSLDEPDNFLNELAMNTKSLKLEQALTHIHTLMKSTANNYPQQISDEESADNSGRLLGE